MDEEYVESILVSKNNSKLVGLYNTGKIRVWNLSDDLVIFKGNLNENEFGRACFSPDQSFIYAINSNGNV